MRKFLLLTTTMLVVCLASGFVSHQTQQKEQPYWRLEVPTPVEDGVLTDRQKEHSKLHERYELKGGDKIRDELMRVAEVRRFRISCGVIRDTPDLVTELAEKADAVVMASFVSKSSQITSSGKSVFTDYDVRIEQVLKDASPGTLKCDAIITVTRLGGKVLLFGRAASFYDSSLNPLMPGRRYLFFLRYIPATGAFETVNSGFDITEAKVRMLSDIAYRPFQTDLWDFINSVKVAITNNQKNGRTQ